MNTVLKRLSGTKLLSIATLVFALLLSWFSSFFKVTADFIVGELSLPIKLLGGVAIGISSSGGSLSDLTRGTGYDDAIASLHLLLAVTTILLLGAIVAIVCTANQKTLRLIVSILTGLTVVIHFLVLASLLNGFSSYVEINPTANWVVFILLLFGVSVWAILAPAHQYATNERIVAWLTRIAPALAGTVPQVTPAAPPAGTQPNGQPQHIAPQPYPHHPQSAQATFGQPAFGQPAFGQPEPGRYYYPQQPQPPQVGQQPWGQQPQQYSPAAPAQPWQQPQPMSAPPAQPGYLPQNAQRPDAPSQPAPAASVPKPQPVQSQPAPPQPQSQPQSGGSHPVQPSRHQADAPNQPSAPSTQPEPAAPDSQKTEIIPPKRTDSDDDSAQYGWK